MTEFNNHRETEIDTATIERLAFRMLDLAKRCPVSERYDGELETFFLPSHEGFIQLQVPDVAETGSDFDTAGNIATLEHYLPDGRVGDKDLFKVKSYSVYLDTMATDYTETMKVREAFTREPLDTEADSRAESVIATYDFNVWAKNTSVLTDEKYRELDSLLMELEYSIS